MAEHYVNELDIRTPSVFQVVKNLTVVISKTVLAKWLFRKAKVLIFDEPTRGIDVEPNMPFISLLIVWLKTE